MMNRKIFCKLGPGQIIFLFCLCLIATCAAGTGLASGTASSRQCARVCPLTEISRHVPILRQRTGPAQTGGDFLESPTVDYWQIFKVETVP